MVFGIGTSRRGARDRRRRGRRLVVPALALALLAPAGPLQAAVAESGGLGRPDVPKPRASKVHEMKGLGAKKAREKVAKGEEADAAQARRAAAEEKATWPEPDTATISLASDQPGTADLGGTPVAVQPEHRARTAPAAGNAQVTVLDQSAAHKAGVTGVLLTAAADSAGKADISVDYTDFASAIGGGWAQRLRLVQLPACALTTPRKAECRQQTPSSPTTTWRSSRCPQRRSCPKRSRVVAAPSPSPKPMHPV